MVEVVATIIGIVEAVLVVFVAVLGLAVEVEGQPWRVLMMARAWTMPVE